LILVAFIVIVRLGSDWPNIVHPSKGTNPWRDLTIAGAILLLVAVVAGIVFSGLVRIGKRRNAAASAAHPNALLVIATRTPEMQDGLRAMDPRLRLRSWFAWAVHDGGASIWQGGPHSIELLTIPWTDIAAIQSVRIDIGRRQFAACSFVVSVSDGGVVHLPFLIRRADRPTFPLRAIQVDEFVARIRGRAPSNASE
jgi:hypothetical protein